MLAALTGNQAQGGADQHKRIPLKVAQQARPEFKDALIIANGFSCREQIAQTTDRRALHLAEVMRLALDPPGSADIEAGTLGDYPERQVWPEERGMTTTWKGMALGAAVLVAAVAIGRLALINIAFMARATTAIVPRRDYDSDARRPKSGGNGGIPQRVTRRRARRASISFGKIKKRQYLPTGIALALQ